MTKNYLKFLNSFDATDEQIERAFRDRVKEHPPRKDPKDLSSSMRLVKLEIRISPCLP